LSIYQLRFASGLNMVHQNVQPWVLNEVKNIIIP